LTRDAWPRPPRGNPDGSRTKRVAALFESEGPTSVAGRALLDRMFLVSRLELIGFAVIIGLMVFKPGAQHAGGSPMERRECRSSC
jgi:hypothetical protein